MKVVLLAGGFGSRLSEMTENIPKPMIKIGSRPIIDHIIKIYLHYGYNEFIIALGYKANIIKEFFLNYQALNSDFTIDLSSGEIKIINSKNFSCKVTLVDTGIDTLTGTRLKKLQSYIGQETFMLTYGDGLSDINIDELLAFHRSHGKLITLSAVRPRARFGELYLKNSQVISFNEKPELNNGWINGGFFVIEPNFFDYIANNCNIMLERQPLELAAKAGELMAYKHEGFWQCMDTKRDYDYLESLCQQNPPWIK